MSKSSQYHSVAQFYYYNAKFPKVPSCKVPNIIAVAKYYKYSSAMIFWCQNKEYSRVPNTIAVTQWLLNTIVQECYSARILFLVPNFIVQLLNYHRVSIAIAVAYYIVQQCCFQKFSLLLFHCKNIVSKSSHHYKVVPDYVTIGVDEPRKVRYQVFILFSCTLM